MNNLYFSILTVATLTTSSLIAQDRHFAWTYESTTLPKGAFDFEPWMTYSTGRETFYNRLDTRLEFEYGVTDRAQTAFYLNAKHKAYALDSAHHAGGETVIYGLEKESEFSFSNEWKFNIMNPSVKAFGLGGYFEYTLSPSEIELEYKILIDKKTEKDIIAFNHVGEYEIEFKFSNYGHGAIEAKNEIIFEHNLSYMRLLKPNLGLGTELRNHSEIVHSELEHSTLFAGPSFFFSQSSEDGKGFFLIAAPQIQIGSIAGEHTGLDLHEHERYQMRLLVGFGF